jgi:hypothetical protein
VSLSSWSIHLFHHSLYPGLQSGAYYVERPYAPFLVFPPPENSLHKPRDFDFIESKGGLTFLLHLYPYRPNFLQRQLYERFGCPLIAPWDELILEQYIHEDYSFRYGRRDHDFFDHHVQWIEVEGSPALLLTKEDRHFLFLGAPWLLDRSTLRHGPTGVALNKLSLNPANLSKKARPIIGLFQFFRGLNWCDVTSMVSF